MINEQYYLMCIPKSRSLEKKNKICVYTVNSLYKGTLYEVNHKYCGKKSVEHLFVHDRLFVQVTLTVDYLCPLYICSPMVINL